MKTQLKIWATVLGLCAGCAEGKDISSQVVIGDLTLTPEGDISQEKVQEYAARWATASGTEIKVGPGGVPVRFVDELSGCGFTYHHMSGEVTGIDILKPGDPHCRPDHALLHEIGHAVCDYGVPGWNECHSAGENDLMFHADNGVMVIDDSSLTEVCSHRNCGAFIPEAL